jgi:hypothetical protein
LKWKTKLLIALRQQLYLIEIGKSLISIVAPEMKQMQTLLQFGFSNACVAK